MSLGKEKGFKVKLPELSVAFNFLGETIILIILTTDF